MNTGIERLIEAYATQDNLADALTGATGQLVHQTRISRWLLDQTDVPIGWIPILVEVGRAAGVEIVPAELRPDAAAVFASD